MSPKVAVCIPTYNRANLLRESLNSVLEQTEQNFEVFLSDNASTDKTCELIAGMNDSRVHYIRQPYNVGLARNLRSVIETAIQQSTAEFIAVLSDDDLFMPNHLATGLNLLSRYPNAAYSTCPADQFGEQSGGHGQLRPVAISDSTTPELYFSPRQAAEFLGIDNPGPLMTMLCRKSAIRQANLYWGKPDYLPIDLLIMTQLMVQGGFVFSNQPTARYRYHTGNVSVPTGQSIAKLRFNCMLWYGLRWLSRMLVDRSICTVRDIESHGLHSTSWLHVVPLVLALASFDCPPDLRAIAYRVFKARKDVDRNSARFRIARRYGFWTIAVIEKVSRVQVGWNP